MSGVDDTVVTAVKVEEAEVPVIEAEAPAPQDPAPVCLFRTPPRTLLLNCIPGSRRTGGGAYIRHFY